MPTLKELSIKYATKQPHQINHLLEETPILNIVPFEESSHSMWNAYDEVTNIDGAGFVDLDAPLPSVGVDTELKKVDLSIMGGKMTVGEDKARLMGGKAAYFANKMPAVLRQTGMNTEKAILYDNIRQYTIDKHTSSNPRMIDAGGSGTGYTLMAVRFVGGETTGLYSPQSFSDGTMLKAKPINGGNLYNIAESGQPEKLGYGVRLKNYFGFMIANMETVACIMNITIPIGTSTGRKIPTAMMVDDLLDLVRVNSNTFLCCHPRVLTALREIKGSLLQMIPENKNIDRSISHWESTPILTSYNFNKGTDANVTVP